MAEQVKSGWRAAPRTVWALGVVSLLMDVSSEMIHGLLPLFLVGTLGASAATLGMIEGVAEATASITKVFSGWLSDRLGKRKLLAMFGYGLGALSKPLFPLTVNPAQVLAIRFADRVGKGIRGAAFGLRQALDTVGAITGPLIAIGLMALMANNIRAVMWWAVVPAILAVLAIAFFVKEPDANAMQRNGGPPVRVSALGRLGAGYWVVIAVAVVFHLARFSEAFLILKAHDAGLSLGMTPLVLVVMSLVYAVVSTPAGELSDKVGRRVVLALGLLALVAADVVLASAHSVAWALVGAALWGLHMGLSQGLLSAMVADNAPADLRGTAFGVFGLTTGLAVLAASAIAGELWERLGATATFSAGAAFAALALGGLWLVHTKTPAGEAGAPTYLNGDEG
jgi:MFS family permease